MKDKPENGLGGWNKSGEELDYDMLLSRYAETVKAPGSDTPAEPEPKEESSSAERTETSKGKESAPPSNAEPSETLPADAGRAPESDEAPSSLAAAESSSGEDTTAEKAEPASDTGGLFATPVKPPSFWKRLRKKDRQLSSRIRKIKRDQKAVARLDAKDKKPSHLETLHREIYFLGVQIIRDWYLLRRQATALIQMLTTCIPPWIEHKKRRLKWLWELFSHTSLYPYRDIVQKTQKLSADLGACSAGEKPPRGTRFRIFKKYLSSLSLPLNRIANLLAPIVGCFILAAVINYFSGLTYALSVEYSGQHLGYIADEDVYYAAQEEILDRLMDEEYLAPEDNLAVFQLAIVPESALSDKETMAGKILSVSDNQVEAADGIYIDGAFLGAIKDGHEFLMYLDNLLEGYRTGTEHELVQFIKSVSVRDGVYPTHSVMTLAQVREALDSEDPLETLHTVAVGDTLESIAARYDTTVDEILDLNPGLEDRTPVVSAEEESDPGEEDEAGTEGTQPDSEDSVLIPGEELLVARVNVNLGVQVSRREVYTEQIPYGTDYTDDSRYYEGYYATLSSGIPGTRTVVADVTYVDGEKTGERRISTEVISEPVNERILRGTMKILTVITPGGDTSGSFLWPVQGGTFNGSLGSYYGHTGVDIMGQAGTIIRASKAGTVTYATNISIWPYGKSVVISHGNGTITRYAHLSEVVVQAGQYVEQGQYLGKMGRTGNATGNHLHFEIRINGVVMDPCKFIGYYYPGYWG